MGTIGGMAELPLACSLDTSELPRRLEKMAAIGRTDLLAADVDGRRAVLSFRPAARERLAAIVAAEAECCPFLDMRLDSGTHAVATLAIEAPAGAEPVVQDLVAAFSGGAPA